MTDPPTIESRPDINTLQQWKNIIENKAPAMTHEHFLFLAAQHAQPEELEHLALSYPLLVQAIKDSKEHQCTI